MYQIHLYLLFKPQPNQEPAEHPHVLSAIANELKDWHRWTGRAVVLAFAALAGATVVLFTWMTEHAFATFFSQRSQLPWLPLIWTPLSAAAIVALTLSFAPGAAGSGIPQVMAALSPQTPTAMRGLFVSLRLSVAKMLVSTWGLLAGLSLGREGPSVQVAAGVMHHARRWMPQRAQVSDHGLLTAGGAAGIAAAFNTPLGGVMFAIEELSKHPEHRHHGLLLAAIVLGGLMGVATQGETFGSGYAHTRNLLEGQGDANPVSVLLKFMATWLTAWSGVPGGIFAPSLSIGGAMGHELAGLSGYPNTATLIALDMAAFLAAVTQAPLTSFIIVMEMVTGHAMVLSLMASALVASGISRVISAPLYSSLAGLQLNRLPARLDHAAGNRSAGT